MQAKYSGAPSRLAEKGSLSTMVVSALSSIPNIMSSTRPKSSAPRITASESKEQGSKKDVAAEGAKADGKSPEPKPHKERGSPDQASKKRDPEELSIDSSQSKDKGEQSSQVSAAKDTSMRKIDGAGARDAPLRVDESADSKADKKKREHKSRKSGPAPEAAKTVTVADSPHRERKKEEEGKADGAHSMRKSRKSSRREGYLLVQRSSRPSQWRKKWFILYSDRLSYYKAKEREQRQGTVALFSATIERREGDVAGHGHLIAVSSPDRLFLLSCESAAEQAQWYDDILRNINWISKNPPISGLAIGRTVRLTTREQKATIEETQKSALELTQANGGGNAPLGESSSSANPSVIIVLPSSPSGPVGAQPPASPPVSPSSAPKSAMKRGDGKSRKRATISEGPAQEIKT